MRQRPRGVAYGVQPFHQCVFVTLCLGTDDSGGCTWDFVINKACAGGVGWAVGNFIHAHSQGALRVYTSPHLAAFAQSVCVGVARSLSIARSFLADVVHVNEKASGPSLPSTISLSVTI